MASATGQANRARAERYEGDSAGELKAPEGRRVALAGHFDGIVTI